MKTENRKKRVVVLTTVHDPNDTRIFHREIPSLLQFGYEVIYCCKAYPSTPTDAEINILWTPSNKFLRVLLAPIAAFFTCLKFKQIDVFHFHDPELIITGLLLKVFGKKVIYDVHEDVPKQMLSNDWVPQWLLKPMSVLIGKLESFSSLFFDTIIAVTQPISELFPSAKTGIVQNFPSLRELEAEKFNPYQSRPKNLIYVGEASDIRGLRELIYALDLVDEDIKLTLIGRISTAGLEDELSVHEGWKKVEFLGLKSRSEVAEYLNQSRIGIVCFHPEPNHLEAQPNKLFEYMSVGIPVIASNFPKWKTVVEANKTGVSINPLSVDELANAITYLIENDVEAEQMGKNGKRLVEQKYSWEAEEVQLKKAYQSILE